MVAQLGWRRFRFTWRQVSVLFSPGGRAEPRPWHHLPRHQSEASQSTTKVTKHSAATAGQLPLGTGGEFVVDQSRIFGTSNRENFTGIFFHSVAFNREFPPTPILRGTPSQYKRRNSGSACVLSQYASGRTTSNSKHSHRFPVHTSHSAELRSRRHLCNDRCRWSKQRLKPWRFSRVLQFTVKVS